LNLGTPRAGKYLPGDCAVRIDANAAWRMYYAGQRCALEIVARGEAKKISSMQHATQRPYADPEKAARKLLDIASTIEPVQDGRIYIEKINGPFLFKEGGRRVQGRP
jgi:hypothetical protein